MADRLPQKAAILLSTPVARFLDNTAVVLPGIDGITAGPAKAQLVSEGIEQRSELPLIVEGSDDLMSPLTTVGVVGVVAHDVSPEGVVVRVGGGHGVQSGPARGAGTEQILSP